MKYSGGRKAATKRFHDKQYARLKALEADNPFDPEVIKYKSDQKARSKKWSLANRDQTRDKSRKWRANNPGKVKAQKRRHFLKKRAFVRSTKDQPCTDCGHKHPYYVMHFDHLRDKEFGIGERLCNRSFQQLKDEIAKCELVCANCHSERTERRRNKQELIPSWLSRTSDMALLIAA